MKVYTIAGDSIRSALGPYLWNTRTRRMLYSARFAGLCKVRSRATLHRILRAYPGEWQVHLVNEDTGEAVLVTTYPERPTYRELEALIR